MFDDVLERAHRWARWWLGTLADRPVGVPVAPEAMRAHLDDHLPDEGEPAAQVLDDLAAAMEPGLVASAGRDGATRGS